MGRHGKCSGVRCWAAWLKPGTLLMYGVSILLENQKKQCTALSSVRADSDADSRRSLSQLLLTAVAPIMSSLSGIWLNLLVLSREQGT